MNNYVIHISIFGRFVKHMSLICRDIKYVFRAEKLAGVGAKAHEPARENHQIKTCGRPTKASHGTDIPIIKMTGVCLEGMGFKQLHNHYLSIQLIT